MKVVEDLQAHRAANPKARHYPEELRRAVVAHMEEAVGRGERRAEVAARLGVHASTIYLWQGKGEPQKRKGFVQIKTRSASPALRSPIVVQAGRVRVEGCELEEVARLLRLLDC